MKYSREDYMSGKCTHEEYYGQYVNTAVRGFVLNAIGEKALRSSTDKNFNDIPLVMWDRMHPYLVRFAPDNSLCASVCLAKEAARQIAKESNNCYRCASVLKNGLCTDVTCPYSDHPQSWDYETNSQ